MTVVLTSKYAEIIVLTNWTENLLKNIYGASMIRFIKVRTKKAGLSVVLGSTGIMWPFQLDLQLLKITRLYWQPRELQ